MNQDNLGKEEIIKSILAGMADPEKRKLAQQIAEAIPPENTFRAESLERLVMSYRGFLEAAIENLRPAAGTPLEKFLDFYDFLSRALGSQPGYDLDVWADKVLKNADERLRNAADPVAEMERVELEFKFRKELVELIKDDLPLAPLSPDIETTLQSWAAKLDAFSAELKKKMASTGL